MDNCNAKQDGGFHPDWDSFARCRKCKKMQDHVKGKCTVCGTERELGA